MLFHLPTFLGSPLKRKNIIFHSFAVFAIEAYILLLFTTTLMLDEKRRRYNTRYLVDFIPPTPRTLQLFNKKDFLPKLPVEGYQLQSFSCYFTFFSAIYWSVEVVRKRIQKKLDFLIFWCVMSIILHCRFRKDGRFRMHSHSGWFCI